ncbi:MAG TPA: hypothetical protein VFA23_00515 [Dongiaceae bacterium]|nr:hypothetical protein [Dongiaceae bacterium]
MELGSSKTDNVVLTRAAAAALRAEFIGWQCRIRQMAARQDGGRPSPGMRPRAVTREGHEVSPGVVVLIVEAEPSASTQLFRYQYLKTQDPAERYAKALEILQACYFQQPAQFSDVMTALFGPGSPTAAGLLSHGRCLLEFEQYAQGYRIPCAVAGLPEHHPFFQATYWHNRLFNPNLPSGIEILSFTPDWPHAAGFPVEPRADE